MPERSDLLKHLMTARGISFARLAVALGVSTAMVQDWRRGARPISDARWVQITRYFETLAREEGDQ